MSDGENNWCPSTFSDQKERLTDRPTLRMFFANNPVARYDMAERLMHFGLSNSSTGFYRGLTYGLGMGALWSLAAGQPVRAAIEGVGAVATKFLSKRVESNILDSMWGLGLKPAKVPDDLIELAISIGARHEEAASWRASHIPPVR